MGPVTFTFNRQQHDELVTALNTVAGNIAQLNQILAQLVTNQAQAEQINQLTAKLKASSDALANAVSFEATPR